MAAASYRIGARHCAGTRRSPLSVSSRLPAVWATSMDDSQRRQFRENGYLIVKDVLTQETVAHLNAIFVSPR